MTNRRQSIFITGAASGIGMHTAVLFAGRGWLVGIADLDVDGLERLAARIGAGNCCVLKLDVTDPQQYRQAMEAFLVQTEDQLDVLFNNAGILRMGPNEAISLAQQHLTVNININGVLNGIDCALPALKRTRGAHVVTMSSTSSMYGMPELAVYSASKHAVRALTEALDLEYERYGITVTDVVAPFVNTPMVTHADHKGHAVSATGVNVQPEQVAEVVWKAAHGRRLHWKIHHLTHLLAFVFAVLPTYRRALVKRLCLSK